MNVVQSITTQAHPVVLRFAELFPAQLAGYQTHGERKGEISLILMATGATSIVF